MIDQEKTKKYLVIRDAACLQSARETDALSTCCPEEIGACYHTHKTLQVATHQILVESFAKASTGVCATWSQRACDVLFVQAEFVEFFATNEMDEV